jgi:hypothetical protein
LRAAEASGRRVFSTSMGFSLVSEQFTRGDEQRKSVGGLRLLVPGGSMPAYRGLAGHSGYNASRTASHRQVDALDRALPVPRLCGRGRLASQKAVAPSRLT